jgi:hypothetical protein
MNLKELIAIWEEDGSLDHEELPSATSLCVICDWMEGAVETMKQQETEIERLKDQQKGVKDE